MFTHEELIKAYEYGIDYGLLIAEQERDSEDFGGALVCSKLSPRTCLPTFPNLRRNPHSEAWRQAKGYSMKSFIELLGKEVDRVATQPE